MNRTPALVLLSIAVLAGGCGGGHSSSNSGGTTPPASSIALSLAASSVTLPQGGSIGRIGATVNRTGSTGSVTLTVSGLPAGAMVSFVQPAGGNSGTVALNPGTALAGTYPLTVQASDGTYFSTASLSLILNAGLTARLPGPFSWSSTGPLISAISDASHSLVSVKDPTVVYYNNRWHVYATTADSAGSWNMEYVSFTDWSQAAAAQPYYMDANPGLRGYHCAPELFYFAPQNKWYLVYQSGPPQYSTADDPSRPDTWTAPQSFFASMPATVNNWLDFWAICDTANCYLFFSGDDGRWYRSQTTVANFPSGFSEPLVIMEAANAGDLFEASNVYYLKGLNQYLAIIECMGGSSGHRYFRAFVSDRLDGDWTPLAGANSWTTPFAGINDVSFDSGVTAWTNDISHGEMLRDGYDQTLTIDPANLQFLYQGVDPSAPAQDYARIPWQLGLIRRVTAVSSGLPVPAGGGVPKPSGTPGGLRVLNWAGFKAAVSYTYDDALASQISDYPQLQATGVRMTFFLSCSFDGNSPTWAQAARDGFELGNHTEHHCYADGTGCASYAGSIAAEYDLCTNHIEQTYGVSNVWTTASPYGDTGYDAVAATRFFLNRGVRGGQIAPNDNSDPFNLPCYGASAGDTASKFNSAIDSARSAGNWLIFMFHSLGGDGGYAPVNVADVLESVDHTKSTGDIWADSMVNVGAYWAGQKAVSGATTTQSGGETVVTWTLPGHFPPGKYVRVTVTGGTLRQGGAELPWHDAGYYEVALDPGSLTIAQ